MSAVSSDSAAPRRGRITATAGSAPVTKLQCELVTDFSRLEALSSEWQRLWGADCRAEIFQSPAWAKAWWRAYGQQYTLCAIAVYEHEELVGLAPFVRRANVVQFLGTPQADYADIICDESRATAVLSVVLHALLDCIEEGNEAHLQHLAKHSRIVRYSPHLSRKLCRCLHLIPAENYRTIILRNDREAVFNQLLGKQHTRRRQNKLQKAGQVQFRYLETHAEAQAYLSDFFRHHLRRMAVIGKESACAKPEFCNFLRALVDELEPADCLRFAVLELDGKPLAWAFGFQVNGKFLLYQHTFDVDAWDYTPGEVLLWNLLEYARKKVSREFDFGKGAEAYKNRFTNYERETCSLFIVRPGIAGLLRGFFHRGLGSSHLALGNLKQAIQRHRTGLRIARTLRTRSSEILHDVREARQKKRLLRHIYGLATDTFQGSAWNKSRVEVFVSMSVESNALSAKAPHNEKVNVKVGTLGDLVDLVLVRPDVIAQSELSQCRQRLKQGDRLYIAQENCRVTLFCWIVRAPTMHNAGSSAEKPTMFMDECRAASTEESPASYAGLVSFLQFEAARMNGLLRVACREDQPILRAELLRQGFLPK